MVVGDTTVALTVPSTAVLVALIGTVLVAPIGAESLLVRAGLLVSPVYNVPLALTDVLASVD